MEFLISGDMLVGTGQVSHDFSQLYCDLSLYESFNTFVLVIGEAAYALLNHYS